MEGRGKVEEGRWKKYGREGSRKGKEEDRVEEGGEEVGRGVGRGVGRQRKGKGGEGEDGKR